MDRAFPSVLDLIWATLANQSSSIKDMFVEICRPKFSGEFCQDQHSLLVKMERHLGKWSRLSEHPGGTSKIDNMAGVLSHPPKGTQSSLT